MRVQGNQWECPKGRISVGADINALALGEVFCRDPDGPSDATGRHAVANLLTVGPAQVRATSNSSTFCPERRDDTIGKQWARHAVEPTSSPLSPQTCGCC